MKKQMLAFFIVLNLLSFPNLAQKSHEHQNVAVYQVDHLFQQQLADVFNTSLQLKEAFVSSDIAKVKSGVASVKKAVAAADMKLLEGQAHVDWMKYLHALNSSLEGITNASNIESQRVHFAHFNKALYQSIKAFGIGAVEGYYQYCPMALKNQGAYWLSNHAEIRNPYFGDQMLQCGSVKEKL